jgi:hypothetical protein
MNRRAIVPFLSVFLLVLWPADVRAQGTLVRKGMTELIELFTRTGAKQSARELAEIGGERAVREVLEKAALQGGDELVAGVVAVAKSGGPRTLKAIGSDPALMTRALQALPEGRMADAVIEASRQPALMSKLVRAHGDEVLAASARHPGVGAQVIDEFGGAGLKAAKSLGTDDVILLVRTKGFRELPVAAQAKFLGLLERNPQGVTQLLKLAAGGAAIVLTADFVNQAEEKLLGGAGETGPLVEPMAATGRALGVLLVVVVGGYAAIKLWGVWRRTKRRSAN